MVLRVEHATVRCGPYRPSTRCESAEVFDFAEELCEAHFDGKHPSPNVDATVRGKWREGYGYFFGFTSLDALVKWFSRSELDSLRSLGYVVRGYNATVTWEGATGQCAYYTDSPAVVEMPC